MDSGWTRMDLRDLRCLPLCVAPLYFRLKWEHYFGPMRSRLLTALSGLALLGLPGRVLAGATTCPSVRVFGAMGNAGITLVDLWEHPDTTPLDWLGWKPRWRHLLPEPLAEPRPDHEGTGRRHPARQGTLGLTVNDFGYELYREQRFGLAYAMRFGEALQRAVRLPRCAAGRGYGNTRPSPPGWACRRRSPRSPGSGRTCTTRTAPNWAGPTSACPTVLRARDGPHLQ